MGDGVMHNHVHSCCDHDVKWCSLCQKVYCVKCGKEWGDSQPYVYPYQQSLYWRNPYFTYSVSNTGGTDVVQTSATGSCSHVSGQ